MRIGPALGDEVTVPSQQRCRLNEEALETLAGEQSCQRGQQGSVSGLQDRSLNLAPEYSNLMAEHDHLDPEIRVRATEEPDQLEEAEERPVQEQQGHRWMLAA